MKRINLILLLSFLATVSIIAEEKIDDWSHSMTIHVSGNLQYKHFFLVREVYRYAKKDLSDLRIIDSNGEFLPYFISKGFSEEKKKSTEYEPKLIKSFTETKDSNTDQYYDYQILSNESDIAINSVSVYLDVNEYSLQVEIYGRQGYSGWEFVAKDTVFNIGEFSNNNIKFNSNLPYYFYRIKIPGIKEPVAVKECRLNYTESLEKYNQYRLSENFDFTAETKKTESIIKVENAYNLKILNFDISVDSNFKRELNMFSEDPEKGSYLGGGKIYRFKYKENNISRTTIDPKYIPVTADKIFLVIFNNNDKPLKINAVKGEYVVDRIVFEDESNKDCTLYFGNADTERLSYDIENFIPYIEKEKTDNCTLGELKSRIKTGNTKKSFDFKPLFNILMIIVSAILIIGIIFLIRKKKR